MVDSNRRLLVPGGAGQPDAVKDFGPRFAVNYGGGLKMTRWAGPLGLQVDVRGYALPDVFSQRLNVFEITGGVMFSF